MEGLNGAGRREVVDVAVWTLDFREFQVFFFFFPSGRVNVVPHYTTRAAFIDIFYLDYGLLPRHLEY